MTCNLCGKQSTRTDGKLDRQWKRVGETVLCAKCKKQSLSNTVISMPIVGLDGLTWDEFYDHFRAASKEVRHASNIVMRELAKLDEGLGDDGKLTKFQNSSEVYRTVTALEPGLDTNSASSLLNRLGGTYSRRRFEMHVTGTSSLPHFARLQPVPIKGGAWAAGFDPENRPIVSLRLGSRKAEPPRDERFTVRLAGGGQFARQLADFRRIVSGEAVPADAKLVPQFVDGRLRGIMLKMTLTKARKEREAGGEMLVRLGDGNLCQWAGMPPIHLDEAANLIRGHRAQNQRMADDLKHERRWPGRRREGIVHKMSERATRYQNAMRTLCQQTAAKIIGWAARNKIRTIRIQIGSVEALPEFPWAGLVGCVKAHRDAASFSIVEEKIDSASASAKPEAAEPAPAVAETGGGKPREATPS